MTTETFDELPSGSGEPPTKDQVLAIYNHMRARKGGKDPGTKAVLDEVIACGFKTSRASIGRALDGAPGRNPPPEAPNDAERRRQRTRQNNRDSHKPRASGGRPAKPMAKDPEPKQIGDAAVKLLESFIEPEGVNKARALADDDNTSAAQLAIKLDRYRMALGIVAAETLMDNSRAMLVDPRGAAALMDAITVSSKLSGGHQISVKPASEPNGQVDAPVNGTSPNGHPMKEINPPISGMAADLAAFRRERANGNGSRA